MAILMLKISLTLNFKGFYLKLIKFFSPTTFGIYILHIHTIVWMFFLKDRFVFIGNLDTIYIPFLVIFYGVIIFLFCSIIEKIRIYLFEKFNIKNKVKKITYLLTNLLEKAIFIFNKI